MPTFTYEMEGMGGQVNTGTLQASSLSDASARLRANGGRLLHVAPTQTSSPSLLEKMRGFRIEMGPGLNDIRNFTTQLAVMIKAGINIRDAIEGVGEQVENPKFRKIIQQLKSDVEAGQPFSEALAKHPKVFSPLYVNMVRASEMSGSFGKMLGRIATYLGQQAETRSMVRGAMIYPAIIAIMAVVTTIFLLTFVLPRFGKIFAGKEALLPAPTMILMAISRFLREQWYIPVGVVVAGIAAFRMWIKSAKGHVQWDRFKLHMPLFKRMLRALYITRGLHTMGELISAGVPMLETLRITAEVSGNVVYERLWMQVHSAVQEGEKIVTPLQKQKTLPKNVVQMISAGEESGKLGEVLREVADFYAKELRNTIKAMTSMIEPLMIVIMGLIVGFIAMSIILPIFKMSSLAK